VGLDVSLELGNVCSGKRETDLFGSESEVAMVECDTKRSRIAWSDGASHMKRFILVAQ
jgi:hypothetical protein